MKVWKIVDAEGNENFALANENIWSSDETLTVTFEREVFNTPAARKSAYDIYRAFTSVERKEIRTASKNNSDVEDFVDSLEKAIIANRTLDTGPGSDVSTALSALVAAGLISAGRAEEIIT